MTFRALTAGIKGVPAMTAGADPDRLGAWPMRARWAGHAFDSIGLLRSELVVEGFADEVM